METKGEIYMITCTTNNKRYIGQAVCYKKSKDGVMSKHGSEGRFKAHVNSALKGWHGSRALVNAMKEHGCDKFMLRTLLICDISQMTYYENKMVRSYKTLIPNGYNINTPGIHGRHTIETKNKISQSNKGKVRTDQMKEEMRLIKLKGQTLPRYVYRYVDRGSIGYRVMRHPTLPEKKFTSCNITMEEKLQQAIEYVDSGKVPDNHASYEHDDEWRKTALETRRRSQLLPKYIYETHDNKKNTHGYKVRNHPSKKNRQFVSKAITMEEKLKRAIEYIQQEESSENK
jgi:hypothetical protein